MSGYLRDGTVRATAKKVPRGTVQTRKSEGRCLVCDKKLSVYNTNDTCWTHTKGKKPRVRGTTTS